MPGLEQQLPEQPLPEQPLPEQPLPEQPLPEQQTKALQAAPTIAQKAVQALEATDASDRLLQSIIGEFQAVGRLPVTVASQATASQATASQATASQTATTATSQTATNPSEEAFGEETFGEEVLSGEMLSGEMLSGEMLSGEEAAVEIPLETSKEDVITTDNFTVDQARLAAIPPANPPANPPAEPLAKLATVEAIELINERQTDEFADLFEEIEQTERVEQARAMAEMAEMQPAPSTTVRDVKAQAPRSETSKISEDAEAAAVFDALIKLSKFDTTQKPTEPEPIASEFETPESAESDPITLETTAPEPATPEPATPEPAAPEVPAAESTAPESTAPEPAAPEPPASASVLSEPLAPQTIAPEPVAPESTAPESIAPESTAPEPVAPTPVASTPTTAPQQPTASQPVSPVLEVTPPETISTEPTLPSATTSAELDLLSGSQTIEATEPTQRATYQFRLEEMSDFNLVLEGLEADADVALLDNQGNILHTSRANGLTTELLGTTLANGNYQIQITADQATDYRLVLSATPDLAGTSNNLDVSAATYLGGSEDDTASAVEFSPQRELVVAGNFGVAAVGAAAERSLLDSNLNGAAQVVRLSASGQEVLSITHLGDQLNDMDVNRASGTIVAGGDFGIAVLNAAADQVLWSQDLGGAEVERVAIANDGTVVTLHDKTITVWSPDGEQLAQETLTRSFVEDVAIDPASGDIYVAGYDNKYNNVDGNPVQVAFLTGFDSDLGVNWSSWGYDADTLTDGQNDMADTRGYRITVGRDGQLYFLGEVAGGNSVFRWNGKDRSTETLVKYDAFNDPYNSKSPHQTYYARINPDTGEVMQGQLAIARLSTGGSNTVRVFDGSITADEAGNVYIGGRAFSNFDGRNEQTINGRAVGAYTKSDPFALVVSSDFGSRRNWTTFVEEGARGTINGFAVGEGRAAVVGTIEQGSVITEAALQGNAFNAGDTDKSDVYLATWGTDSQFGNSNEVLDLGVDLTNFSVDGSRQLKFSAADFAGIQPGTLSPEAFVLGSQSQSDRPTFLYNNGVLSFDADGTGAQAATTVAQFSGSPDLNAQQLLFTP